VSGKIILGSYATDKETTWSDLEIFLLHILYFVRYFDKKNIARMLRKLKLPSYSIPRNFVDYAYQLLF
jgi:hypothetical protein